MCLSDEFEILIKYLASQNAWKHNYFVDIVLFMKTMSHLFDAALKSPSRGGGGEKGINMVRFQRRSRQRVIDWYRFPNHTLG